MFERAIVPIILFVFAFAALLAYRWFSQRKLGFQLWDALIAVVPSLIWMIGSGYFSAVELGPNGFKIQRAAEALVQANDTLVRTVYQPLKAVDFSDIATLVEPYAEEEEPSLGQSEGPEAVSEPGPAAMAAPEPFPDAASFSGGSFEVSPTPLAEPEFEGVEPQGDADTEEGVQVSNILRGFDAAIFRPAHGRYPARVIGAFFEAAYNADSQYEIPVDYVVFGHADGKLAMFCEAAVLAFSRRYYAGVSGAAGRYYELIQQKIGHPDELISLLGGDAGGRHIHTNCYMPSQAVSLDQNISAAVSAMDTLDRSYLPVVDLEGRFVGIVVQNDLVNHVVLQVLKASEDGN